MLGIRVRIGPQAVRRFRWCCTRADTPSSPRCPRHGRPPDAASERRACSPATSTCATLATTSGVSHQHLSRIERGIDPITSSDAADLGEALNCPADWLAHGWASCGRRQQVGPPRRTNAPASAELMVGNPTDYRPASRRSAPNQAAASSSSAPASARRTPSSVSATAPTRGRASACSPSASPKASAPSPGATRPPTSCCTTPAASMRHRQRRPVPRLPHAHHASRNELGR